MGWEDKVRSRIKTGGTYTISSIGKIKVIGRISQFGGNGSGGGLFVKCEVLESYNPNYKVGDTGSYNCESMF